MEQPAQQIFTSHQHFGFWNRIGDLLAGWLLRNRAIRHLRDGYPPMAAFAFDYIGREISIGGRFERDELTALDDFLAPLAARFAGGSALDVGANIGNHSLFFSRRFAHVHCFEPNPRTFGLLSVNAQLSANMILHNKALGDAPGTLTLSYDSLNVGEASLVNDSADGTRQHTEVDVVRLDDLQEQFGQVALIKIDVEGFEPEVLRGATDLLRSQKPVVLFEQNRAAFRNGRSEAASLLTDAGYVLCILTKRHISRGPIGQFVNTLRKSIGGIRYDVCRVETLVPDDYALIIAVDPADYAQLSRVQK